MMMDDIYFSDPVECPDCHKRCDWGSMIWLKGRCICPECYEKNRILDHHGGKLDCDNCEDKALSYSMGFQDGYLLGGFQLTELRRWLIAQGYSEGTVDDKINEFTRFVEKIRGEEE